MYWPYRWGRLSDLSLDPVPGQSVDLVFLHLGLGLQRDVRRCVAYLQAGLWDSHVHRWPYSLLHTAILAVLPVLPIGLHTEQQQLSQSSEGMWWNRLKRLQTSKPAPKRSSYRLVSFCFINCSFFVKYCGIIRIQALEFHQVDALPHSKAKLTPTFWTVGGSRRT